MFARMSLLVSVSFLLVACQAVYFDEEQHARYQAARDVLRHEYAESRVLMMEDRADAWRLSNDTHRLWRTDVAKQTVLESLGSNCYSNPRSVLINGRCEILPDVTVQTAAFVPTPVVIEGRYEKKANTPGPAQVPHSADVSGTEDDTLEGVVAVLDSAKGEVSFAESDWSKLTVDTSMLDSGWMNGITKAVQEGWCTNHISIIDQVTNQVGWEDSNLPDEPVALAIALTESNCGHPPRAGKEIGDFQTKQSTCTAMGVGGDLNNLYTNAFCAVQYLKSLCIRHGHCEVYDMVSAYNGGPNPARDWSSAVSTYRQKIAFSLRAIQQNQ